MPRNIRYTWLIRVYRSLYKINSQYTHMCIGLTSFIGVSRVGWIGLTPTMDDSAEECCVPVRRCDSERWCARDTNPAMALQRHRLIIASLWHRRAGHVTSPLLSLPLSCRRSSPFSADNKLLLPSVEMPLPPATSYHWGSPTFQIVYTCRYQFLLILYKWISGNIKAFLAYTNKIYAYIGTNAHTYVYIAKNCLLCMQECGYTITCMELFIYSTTPPAKGILVLTARNIWLFLFSSPIKL